ncbi:MAG: HAMP domain-containing sensor histidine kinase [Pirellulales bacterium]
MSAPQASSSNFRWIRSLRFRLTAWNTAIVFLAVVVALVGVREGLRFSLRQEIDQLLKEEIQVVALTVTEAKADFKLVREELDRIARGHQQRGYFSELLDEHGEPLWTDNNVPKLDLPPLTGNAARVSDVGGYRVAEQRLIHKEIPPLVIRVGTHTNFIDEDVENLTEITVPVGLAILALSPLGGYWLAGRATKPLADINSTTAKLRPSNLSERLPLRGAGDELDQLSATTNHFLDRIATYLQHNQQFVHNAAHELRSPLTAIQSSVEVALASDRSLEEYKELLELILNECAELGLLVNQLLLLAETDAELRLPKQRVQLDRVAARSLDMFRGLAEERGIELQADLAPDVWIEGHPTRLRQVVNNLIDNALKFTPEKGRVSVRLSTDREVGLAVLTVADTGTGIQPTDLPHIFDRFYRGETAQPRGRVVRGTGLGLSICQSIVEAHGGRITAESALGRGTTMTVYLPRGEAR